MRRFIVLLIIGVLLGSAGASGAQDEGIPDYLVEAFVSNETPFVGEQILYVFRWYAYVMLPGITDRLPDFEGFWLADVYELTGSRIETINNRQYIVGELYAEITPLNTGQITIRPSTLEIPETVFRRGQRLRTEPVTLHVQPLPPGAPGGFNGAVGQFTADFRIDQTSITLGQPVTLSGTVDGTGNLEQLPAPYLSWVSGWRVYTRPARYVISSIGGLRFGQKIFEWLLVPEQTGTQTFPPVVFTFFDPQAQEYRSIASPPFTVQVFPGADNRRELPSLEISRAAGTAALPLKQPPTTLGAHSAMPASMFWLVWTVPPLITFGCGAWVYWRNYEAHRRRAFRYRTALQRANQRLRATQKASSPQQANQQIMEAILTYLTDKLGYRRETLSQAEIMERVSSCTLDPVILEALQSSLIAAEGGRYIPQGMRQDIRPLVTQVMETLAQLEKRWSKHD